MGVGMIAIIAADAADAALATLAERGTPAWRLGSVTRLQGSDGTGAMGTATLVGDYPRG
jgi:phosphoribosylformylglycinamidine cyclo-ligase